jgi:hypothetical protein
MTVDDLRRLIDRVIEIFEWNSSAISRYLNTVFREEKLPKRSNMQKMHFAPSDNPTLPQREFAGNISSLRKKKWVSGME